METIHTVNWMKQVARQARADEHMLGLVPTMGALHEGHFSLIREAKRQCSPVVVSIFVNPTQFGPAEDFIQYPRPLDRDRAALEELRVDYLFTPTVEEMYPKGFHTAVVVEGLSDRLEGKARPGHFRGVATVVLKLLEIVQPRVAFFGRKDAQQARVIRQMVRDLDLEASIEVCPIVREQDGLAISSRNAYLNGEERRSATALYQSLEAVRGEVKRGQRDTAQLLAALGSVIDTEPGVRLDYAEIVDADTLERVMRLRGDCYALVAAMVGNTRLIDNALIEEEGGAFRVTI
ncbi:MAG TPA: pantoate--beta-alanine ligase [Candidatus Acidoferrales bacterium]|nr:pantoate--beta-alanine ligase [Candidatus Acidoferrales bacterium]